MIRNLLLASVAPMLWLGAMSPVVAQEVLHDVPGHVRPAAQLRQAAWLSGNWRGVSDAGDEVLESWIGPKGDLMAGSFLELASDDPEDGVVNWAEHMVIVSNGYSLAFHSNTFNAQIGATEFIERRLLRIEDDGCQLYFHGVTFICRRAEQSGEVLGMTIYWKEAADEFNPEPELFTYTYSRD